MGGAASVLATALGAPVHGVVTIAAPADVMEVTAEYLRDKGFPGGFMVVALRPFWWRRVRGTFRRLVPEREIRRIRHPVLVVHPEADRRVSQDHAERLARNADTRPSIIPGAGHTDVLGRTETHRAIVAFLEGLTPSEGTGASA